MEQTPTPLSHSGPSDRPLAGRSLHFIGIGGAGMSGLALVAHALGGRVTGSDRADSPYCDRLRDAGLEPLIGHDAANLPAGAEVVVSTAIPDDNPELSAARAAGATVLHRGALLGELSRMKRTIAVSGTHGKTTTAAMAAHVLAETGRDPGFLIGGELRSARTNAAWGAGEWAVIEADESDRSFLELARDVAVITNIELDHHSTYANLAELEQAFGEFAEPAALRILGPDVELSGAGEEVGFAIAGEDEAPPRATRGAREGEAPRATRHAGDPSATRATGAAGAVHHPRHTLRAERLQLLPGGSRFEVEGTPVELRVPGRHNALNALAAMAACRAAGVEPAAAAPALSGFTGASRRFERHGRTPSGALVFDDYAHHPTEVRATLEAARIVAAAEGGRLVACFQPHLYSRTRMLAREFGRALSLADLVVVLDVYPARERPEDFPGVTGLLVAEAAADAAGGRPVWWLPRMEDAERMLAAELHAGDLIVTLGAGDVDALARRLAP
jgi:UDP-N-acetylmuramate--alanine ligase